MKPSSRSTPFAKKSLGQNFLTDVDYIRKIVDAVDPSPEDTIVEIGPGRGALTEHLVDSGSRVVAIELDREMIPMLRQMFAGKDNFAVIEQDVLQTDLADVLDAKSEAEIRSSKLVANLPYYISTAILQRLASQRELFSEMILMFQREVVDRIAAEPGNSERGFLTVIVEAAFRVEKLFDVPPTAFSPRPKIWSSVVRLIPKSSTPLDDERFVRLVGTSFAQKRKTLLNNLKSGYPDAANIIELSGIDPTRRAESLTLEEWSNLYAVLVQS